jgi:hypothetical protein
MCSLNRPLIVVLAIICTALSAPALAGAVAPKSATSSHKATGATHKSTKPAAKTTPTSSTPVTTVGGSAEPVSTPTNETNPNDSLVNNDVLSLSDPACGLSGMTVEQASRCLRTGDPSVPYPLGNYQMDIHMSTGVTHPVNDVLTILEAVMNVVWLLLLYILKGALTLTGWAFSLSPFTNTATLGSAQSKLESVYKALDGAWLDSVFVAIGGYAAYVGFVRRRQSEAVGHLGASVAAILLAMAIIHAPRTFVGKPAGFVNSFAQDAISSANLAAHNQSGTVPNSKLASLTGDLFDTFATGPFCALETNDVSWCMSPPSSLEMKAVQRAVKGDKGYEKQAKAIAADVAGRLPVSQQRNAYNAVYKSLTSGTTPSRRADLFLRYPPGSAPRETLYALYSGENLEGKNPVGELINEILAGPKSIIKDASKGEILAVAGDILKNEVKAAWAILKFGIHTIISLGSEIFGGGGSSGPKPLAPNKIAIQGSSGLVQRCLVLMLTVLALVGVLLVLVWLAVHLVSQALLGFVLLLGTPVMMLSPAFGVGGRKAFGTWAKTLFGAIASKAFYAAFLGVFILALTALQEASTAALGPTTHLGIGALANTATKAVSQGSVLQPEGGGSGAGGWGVPWVMQCLLCWAVFFKRNKIVGFFAIDPTTHQQSGSASMTGMRVMGAAYAAHRLGGVVAGAASRPINAYRTNASERAVGREEATRDLAYGELEGQELGAAARSHDHHAEREGIYKKALDNTQAHAEKIKQNPDYKKYTAWKQSQNAHEGVFGAPKTHGPHQPPKPTTEEQGRGEAMAAKLSKLESGKRVLQARHAQAQDVVRHGERNLREHGQVLSPTEVSSRVEARRNSLTSNSGDPNAWKRAENLELASGRRLTPQRLKGLEQEAKHKNPQKAAAARLELDSTRRQVTARMETSERLLQGVPSRNQFDKKRAPGSSATAEQEISRRPHGRAELDRLADTRVHEMKRQRYLRRRHVYRS